MDYHELRSSENKPKCMTVEEACRYIGIKKTSMYALFKGKKLKQVKLGGRTLVLTSELDALIEALAREAA